MLVRHLHVRAMKDVSQEKQGKEWLENNNTVNLGEAGQVGGWTMELTRGAVDKLDTCIYVCTKHTYCASWGTTDR